MNRFVFAFFIAALTIMGCKSSSKPLRSTDVVGQAVVKEQQLSGHFVYFADVAIFRIKNERFSVIENEKAQELIKLAAPLKADQLDEVAVILKARILKKPEHEEGLENQIEIMEIIKVSKPTP